MKKNQEIGEFFRQSNAKTTINKKNKYIQSDNIKKIYIAIKIANEIISENDYKKINYINVQSDINPKRIIVPNNRRASSVDNKKEKK